MRGVEVGVYHLASRHARPNRALVLEKTDQAMAKRDHDRLVGWMPVAAPLGVVPADEMLAPDSDKPVRLLVPEHDQFRTPAAATEATAGWANATIEIVPGTDHFLAGGLGVVMDQLSSFVDQLT